MRPYAVRAACVFFFAAVAYAAGCGDSSDSEFPPTPTPTDEGGVTPPPFDPDSGGAKDSGPAGCGAGCPAGTVCVSNRCIPPQGKCAGDAGAGDGGLVTCQFDTYCDLATGTCVPYGSGKDNDPTCHQLIVPGNFAPKVKCEFPPAAGIAGDAFPNHVEVQATPMVARFGAASVSPSIVVPYTVPIANDYSEDKGVIRILKGTDCTQEATIGGVDYDGDGQPEWARSSSPVAIADLDGDKLPEIVAYMSSGTTTLQETLMAFTRKSGTWQPLWATKKATQADGTTIFTTNIPFVSATGGKGNWAGPSIHDLDDDGKPEVVREGYVFDGQTGKLRAGLPPNYGSYLYGIPPVLANLDADPKIELTNGARIWEFDGATNTWVEDATYNASPTPAGWVAIADFDPYDGKKTPEIAVATNNTLYIYKTDHTLFMNMQIPVPAQGGSAGGGPPTIADFDGDGLPEVALAGRAFYTVFDPDCTATPRPGGKCADRTHCDFDPAGACPDGILWSRSTQDISSNVTGSSIFDFEADGKAEVIYADECFTRVYSGSEGRVVFSRYRSSCTWLENPIVADVDGDFRAELIVPSNNACGPLGVGISCTRNIEQGDIDAQFAGLVCLENKDCVSGICTSGLCRCTTSADCCPDKDATKCEEFGTKCAAPPAGTPGAGNTCRANHPHGSQGIRVFEDAADRWVRSRPIWNQHAYAVTHVNEDGTIPKTSAWAKNWTSTTPKLNNFRQNVPGNQNATDIGDLTSQTAGFVCDNGKAILSAPICNRGTAPVGAGVSVGFYVGTSKVCTAKTTAALAVGKCETVTCTWTSPPSSPTDVTVKPNDDGAIAQCHEDNDKGLVIGVACTAPK